MRLIKRNWTRRDFVRAAGITGGAALLTQLMPRVGAAAPSGLKRLILVHNGNGSVLDAWRSNGSGTPFKHDQTLPALKGPILAPFDSLRERVLLLDGIDIGAVYDGKQHLFVAKGHFAASVLWTGRGGGGTGVQVGDGTTREFPDGPSLDQVVQKRLNTGQKALQIESWKISKPAPNYIYSFDAKGTPLPGEHDPRVVFDDVFRDGFPSNQGSGEPDRRPERRKRALAHLKRRDSAPTERTAGR